MKRFKNSGPYKVLFIIDKIKEGDKNHGIKVIKAI